MLQSLCAIAFLPCPCSHLNPSLRLTSSLISQQDFEMKYCYHYCDISRMLPIEESVPKAVQIIGQNLSAKAIDIVAFLEYSVSISVDVLTGSRV